MISYEGKTIYFLRVQYPYSGVGAGEASSVLKYYLTFYSTSEREEGLFDPDQELEQQV